MMLTLAEFSDAISHRPRHVHLDQRLAAYGRMLAQHFDLHQAQRRFNETVYGFAYYGAKQIEIDPGRRVPNDWDRAVVETWVERKGRRALERELAGLEAAGLATPRAGAHL